MKIGWPFLIALLSAAGFAQGESPCPPAGAVGQWSREATRLCPQYSGRDFKRDMWIHSPDGKVTLRVGYERWWLETEGRKILLPPAESRLTDDDSRVAENAEVAWAEDSKTFFLTQSENRAGIQGFYTGVYRVRGNRVVSVLDVNRIVQREFDRHHKCVSYDARGRRYSGEADIGAVKWVDDSDQLLMVAETPFDSDCERGYFAGYLISLKSGTVVHRYTARQLMQEWDGVVGDRLKEDFRDLEAKQKDATP